MLAVTLPNAGRSTFGHEETTMKIRRFKPSDPYKKWCFSATPHELETAEILEDHCFHCPIR